MEFLLSMLGFFGCSFSPNLFGSPSADLLDLQTTWVPSDALLSCRAQDKLYGVRNGLGGELGNRIGQGQREKRRQEFHTLSLLHRSSPQGPVLSSLLWGNYRLLGTRHLGLGVSHLQFPGNTSCPAPGELGACGILQCFSQGKGSPWLRRS